MKKLMKKWLNAECNDWAYLIPFGIVMEIVVFLKLFIL